MKDLAEVFQDSDPALKALLADVGVFEEEEGGDTSETQAAEEPARQQPLAAAASEDDTQDTLLQELRELKETLAAKKEAPKETDEIAPEVPDLKDEDLGTLADYRERLEQIAQVGAAKGFKPVVKAVNELRQQLAQLQAGTTQQQEALAQQVFVNALRAQVPDIDQLYQSKEFTDFLAQPAPLAHGRTFGELLEEAHNARDVGQISEIIGMFREKHGGNRVTDPYMRPDLANAAPGTPGSGDVSNTHSRAIDKLVDARRRLRKLRSAGKITDAEYQQAVLVIQRKEDDILRRAESFGDLMRAIA